MHAVYFFTMESPTEEGEWGGHNLARVACCPIQFLLLQMRARYSRNSLARGGGSDDDNADCMRATDADKGRTMLLIRTRLSLIEVRDCHMYAVYVTSS